MPRRRQRRQWGRGSRCHELRDDPAHVESDAILAWQRIPEREAMDDVETHASMRGAEELEEGSGVIPLAGDADSDDIVAGPDLDDTSNESWEGASKRATAADEVTHELSRELLVDRERHAARHGRALEEALHGPTHPRV